MNQVVRQLGGPAGLIRLFGRLLPNSLISEHAHGRRSTKCASPDYCATLEGDELAAEWLRVTSRASAARVLNRHGWELSLHQIAPPSEAWCAGAPPWIVDCLSLFNAVERPDALIGMGLGPFMERVDLGSTQLIVLLLYIESAWRGERPDLRSFTALGAASPDGVIVPVEWQPGELPARASALLQVSGKNLPTMDDLRFADRLESICQVGQSVRKSIEAIANGACAAAVDDQMQLVDGLERALRSTAGEEIGEIGQWAIVRRFQPDLRARNVEIFRARFGLDGASCSTLTTIGDRYGMTRERVRQIVDRMQTAIASQSIWAPACAHAYEIYLSKLPARKSVLSSDPDLREALGPHLEPVELERFAVQFLGMKAKRKPTVIKRGPAARVSGVVVLTEADAKIATAVQKWTVRAVSHVGAAQAEWIAGRATKETGRVVTDEHVVSLLKDSGDFEWLHESSGWLWLRDSARNRLANRIERILCTRPMPMPMDILYGGLIRSDRDKRESGGGESTATTLLPPSLVVAALCRKLPFAGLNGHNHVFFRDCCRPPEEVLGGVALTLLQAVRANRGIVRRGTAREYVLERLDVTKQAFEIAFTDAPFLICLGKDLWGLRGHPIDAARLAEAQDSIAETYSTIGQQHADRWGAVERDSGSLTWGLHFNEALLRNHHVAIPARASDQIALGPVAVNGLYEGTADIVGKADWPGLSIRFRGLVSGLIGRVVVGSFLRLTLCVPSRTLSVTPHESPRVGGIVNDEDP